MIAGLSPWHHPRTQIRGVALLTGMSVLMLVIVTAASLTLCGHVEAAQPKPQPTPSATFTLQWVGDMALSTQRGLPPGGFLGAVHAMRGYLGSADLAVGNLEGTLSVGGPSKCGVGPGRGTCFAFQAPPAYAEQLHAAGFAGPRRTALRERDRHRL